MRYYKNKFNNNLHDAKYTWEVTNKNLNVKAIFKSNQIFKSNDNPTNKV